MFYFYGVETGTGRRVGYINSDAIVDCFDEKWIPSYQRDRITVKRKVDSLISIFKEHKPIDTIKLSLKGELTSHKGELLLDGRIHVIDGQQRLWSLKESGVRDYRMPVELYVNLDEDEEIELFHQFNTEGTKLTFGELAMSYRGPLAEMVQRIQRSKNYPVKLSVNHLKKGMTLSVFCPLIYWVHRKLVKDLKVENPPAGKLLRSVLQDPTVTQYEVKTIEFSVRQLIDNYIRLFGNWDPKARAYRRQIILGFMHVFVDNFLLDNGRLEFRTFKRKLSYDALADFLKDAYTMELSSEGARSAHKRVYNHIIEYLNRSRKGDRLPMVSEKIIMGRKP